MFMTLIPFLITVLLNFRCHQTLISTHMFDCDNDGSHFQYFKWGSEHREEYNARISTGIFKEEITSLMHEVDDASCETDNKFLYFIIFYLAIHSLHTTFW